MTRQTVSKEYQRTKLFLALGSTFIGWIYLFVLWISPLGNRLVEQAAKVEQPYAGFLMFLLLAGLIAQLYSLPLSFYSGYMVEHKYGLSNQSLGRWGWEQIKGSLVGLVIGIPVLLVFYFFLRYYGPNWWLPVALFVFGFSIILGRLAPVLLFPLFYKFEALEESQLAHRIQQLCEGEGLSVSGVFRFNLSKNTKKANAAFTGLGKSKRVLLADTLLDNFSEDEIAAVVGHELGHFKLHHIWKGMALGTVITFVGFYLVSTIHNGLVDDVTSLSGLPLLGLLLGLYSFVSGPIGNLFSRRHEFDADAYSIQLLGQGSDLGTALDKLAELNLGDREPHPLVEFLFHSHPSVNRRVERLG
ncbi:M48 family metallopeptidase [Candidatus Neomarinimicrobiota bacterium]